MLERAKVKQIWRGGIRLAAILAGAQVPVAFAKAASHSATVAGIKASVDCAGESALQAVMTLGQTLWGTVDACMLGEAAHAAGVLMAPGAIFNPGHAIFAIVGHELTGHVVSLVLHIFSCS
jgi:hypothetical protein